MRAHFSIGIACAFAGFLPLPASAEAPFAIEVVDASTGRGVPLVELETTHGVVFVTDSAGIAAVTEPGWSGEKVWFGIRSHGYQLAADGFGFAGRALEVVPGARARIEIERVNVAERLCRLTGEGIYRDSELAGLRAPRAGGPARGGVFGQDSTQAVLHGGNIRWFWGDTLRARYPLGNFRVAGAVSSPPGAAGPDPDGGIDLEYFVGDDGFAREMFPTKEPGAVWIDGLVSLPDASGRPRLLCHWIRVKSLEEVLEGGLAAYDEERERWIAERGLPVDEKSHPHGHSFVEGAGADAHAWFGNPFPTLRIRASAEVFLDPSAWETLEPDVRLACIESGRRIQPHAGSIAWNVWARRWIAVFVEVGGESSYLGEVWYAEADHPSGPWRYARKVVTHERYTFYNPVHHPFLDIEGGRVIHFEGTYASTFSGNPLRTPRYDYNQILYRLRLDDPRLSLPRPVYRTPDGRLQRHGASLDGASIAFYAVDPERPHEGLVPIEDPGGNGVVAYGLPVDSDRGVPFPPGTGEPRARVWPP